MKATLIILSVMTVSALAFSPNALNIFYENFHKCAEERGEPMVPTVELMLCVTEKEGMIVDEQGEMIEGPAMAKMDALIEDKGNVFRAWSIVRECFDKAHKAQLSGKELTKFVVQCGISVVDYIHQ